MSLSPRKHSQAGFTLIELLVVIGVIAILAAITFGALSGAEGSAARQRTTAEIAALNTALESYKIDNGVYPQFTGLQGGPEPSSNPSGYENSSKALFTALYGSDKFSAPSTTNKNYFTPKKGMIEDPDGESRFVDPWGFSYGYRSLDDSGAGANSGYNVGFFDLWSTGGATGSGDEDLNKWIVNWPDGERDRITVQ